MASLSSSPLVNYRAALPSYRTFVASDSSQWQLPRRLRHTRRGCGRGQVFHGDMTREPLLLCTPGRRSRGATRGTCDTVARARADAIVSLAGDEERLAMLVNSVASHGRGFIGFAARSDQRFVPCARKKRKNGAPAICCIAEQANSNYPTGFAATVRFDGLPFAPDTEASGRALRMVWTNC